MMRGGKSRSVVCAIVIATLWGSIWDSPAGATITAIGDIVPLYDDSDPWSVSGDLIIGAVADANLVISGGSQVTDDRGFIGLSSNEFVVPEVTVTGAGSLWQNGSNLVIGSVGRGALIIENGGRVTSPSSSVASGPNSGGMVRVTGSGSLWDSDLFRVGEAGIGTVYIEEGGRVTSHTAVLGGGATAAGMVLVSDANSTWENLADPNTGLGGDLSVNYYLGVGNGGHVVSGTGLVNGEVVVDGEGSLWENQTSIQLGLPGTGSLSITNGGTVTTSNAMVGSDPNGEGAIVVDGSGSTLEVEQELDVGLYGNASMSVSDGGRVSAMISMMGAEAGSTATVTVAGTDSSWSGWGATFVGVRGTASLTVSDGAMVYDQGIFGVGTDAGGVGTVVVTGTGSSVGGDSLEVGLDGGHGSMTVAEGARVGSSEAWLGAGSGSYGETLVSGAGSLWEATYNAWIGYSGGEGRLIIADGAQADTLHAFIGAGEAGFGYVLVTGVDSLLTAEHTLYVGGDEDGPGGIGTLEIYNGGVVDGNDVTIWSTGSLEGNGTLRADHVVNRGGIRPGSNLETLTIDGDLELHSSSILGITVNNSGGSSKVLVTGHTDFAGGVEFAPIETITHSQQYTILEANSVTDNRIYPAAFGETDADTGLIRSSVVVGSEEDPNAVFLNVTVLSFDDSDIAQTDNQRSLGAALEEILEGGGNDITTALQQLQTGDEVRNAYNQLSGQSVPSLAPVTVAGTSRHVDTIAGRLRNPGEGLSSNDAIGGSSSELSASVDTGRYLFAAGNGTPTLGDKPWGVWGRGYGLYGDRETESGVPGYDYTVYGAAFGLDYRFTQRVLLGLTGGYSDGDIDYAGSHDSSDVSATHVGVYGGYETPGWYLDSILTYADLDYETRRYVDLLDERLEGDPSGDMFTGYLEAGYNWRHSERTLIQPLAGFQISTLKIDSFTESGGDGALTFDSERYDSYKGSLGAKLVRGLFEHADGCRMDLELRGRWVHEFGDTKASLDAGFASDPSLTFRVSDEDIARDSAVLGAGVDAWFTRQTRVFLDYGTELNADNTIQVVSGGLEHRW